MKERNYWEQFEKTGSVADYLNYRENEEACGGYEGAGYAGMCGSDGDCFEGRADWGI